MEKIFTITKWSSLPQRVTNSQKLDEAGKAFKGTNTLAYFIGDEEIKF
jgi:hypothetical protein